MTKGGTTEVQCQRRGERADALRQQWNARPNSDEVFRATAVIRGGVACFTGTQVGYCSFSATSGTATPSTISCATEAEIRIWKGLHFTPKWDNVDHSHLANASTASTYCEAWGRQRLRRAGRCNMRIRPPLGKTGDRVTGSCAVGTRCCRRYRGVSPSEVRPPREMMVSLIDAHRSRCRVGSVGGEIRSPHRRTTSTRSTRTSRGGLGHGFVATDGRARRFGDVHAEHFRGTRCARCGTSFAGKGVEWHAERLPPRVPSGVTRLARRMGLQEAGEVSG